MNKLRSALSAVLFTVISLAFTSLAQAQQATRTWVSGVGDDTNSCSRTQPCKTFAGAIAKTIAGGEIDALDPGGYGPVIITKSITIDGTGTLASILAAGPDPGITINAVGKTPARVRLRGLSINGVGSGSHGIRIIGANNVTIEDTVIDGFSKNGINVEATLGTQVFVRNTTIRNNEGSGINVVPGQIKVAISGVAVVFNGTGLTPGPGAFIFFENNVIYDGSSPFPSPVGPRPR
jgi:hypothetical protein